MSGTNPIGFPLSPEQREKRIRAIKEGKKQGLTWAEIAKELGTNKIALSGWWTRRTRVERSELTERPCMCCRQPFPSEGIHNRLCVRCKSERMVSPWETVVGTSRRVGKS